MADPDIRQNPQYLHLVTLETLWTHVTLGLLAVIVYLITEPETFQETREIPVAVPCTYCTQWEQPERSLPALDDNWNVTPDRSGTPFTWKELD